MEHTLDLQHDGKRAYSLNGKRVICHDALAHKKHGKIKLKASTEPTSGGDAITLVKRDDGDWHWPDSGHKYPLTVYAGGREVLDTFFPNAKAGETFTIWLKLEVINN